MHESINQRYEGVKDGYVFERSVLLAASVGSNVAAEVLFARAAIRALWALVGLQTQMLVQMRFQISKRIIHENDYLNI